VKLHLSKALADYLFDIKSIRILCKYLPKGHLPLRQSADSFSVSLLQGKSSFWSQGLEKQDIYPTQGLIAKKSLRDGLFV
jgi:hypothetical protein